MNLFKLFFIFSVITNVAATSCEEKRNEALQSNAIGRYIPQCNEEGNYRKFQVHGSTGYLWCVDETTGERTTEPKPAYEVEETFELFCRESALEND